MATGEPNGQVSYSVKELLAKLDGKVDSVLIAVADKVGRSEFDLLRKDVDVLRLQASSSRSVGANAKWLWNALSPLVAAGLTYFLTH